MWLEPQFCLIRVTSWCPNKSRTLLSKVYSLFCPWLYISYRVFSLQIVLWTVISEWNQSARLWFEYSLNLLYFRYNFFFWQSGRNCKMNKNLLNFFHWNMKFGNSFIDMWKNLRFRINVIYFIKCTIIQWC